MCWRFWTLGGRVTYGRTENRSDVKLTLIVDFRLIVFIVMKLIRELMGAAIQILDQNKELQKKYSRWMIRMMDIYRV